jgi:signal transduction histidine kinase/Tfp pilus assembly protein PilF
MGRLEHQNSQFDQAISTFQIAFEIAIRENALYEQVWNLIFLGHAQRKIGEFDFALKSYDQAQDIVTKAGEKFPFHLRTQGVIAHSQAIIYQYNSNLALALDNYFKRLKYSEKSGDVYGAGQALISIGNIFSMQEKLERAKESYQKAINILSEINSPENLALAYSNLGNVYFKFQKYDSAFNYYTLALKTFSNIKSKQGIANSYNNIGKYYAAIEQYNKAIDYFNLSLEITNTTGNVGPSIESHWGLSYSFFKLIKINQAHHHISKALKMAQKVNVKSDLQKCHQLLSEIYEKKGEINKAFDHYKRFKLYDDSLNRDKNNRKTVMLTAQYEYDKKENLLKAEQAIKEANFMQKVERQQWVIILILCLLVGTGIMYIVTTKSKMKLGQANRNLVQANESIKKSRELLQNQSNRLEDLNATKDKVFSIIGHDLRSPFKNLTALLNMMVKGDITMDEFRTLSFKISNSLAVTSETLENLLEWSRSQMKGFSNNQELLDTVKIVSGVLELFGDVSSSKNIEITFDIPDGTTVLADKNQIKLILRNLINNAIKFTPSGGSVTVSAEPDGPVTVIAVSDTGVGLSQEEVSKLLNSNFQVSAIGTNGEMGSGLGLMLCKEMAEQNKGQLIIFSEKGVGSSFILELPAAC